jgi:hypothetical protein
VRHLARHKGGALRDGVLFSVTLGGRGGYRNEADSPMSILIVEDDPFVASTIREVLGELGFCRCRDSVLRQRARSSMLSRLRTYSRSNVER